MGSVISFTHVHIVDGVTIVHSHPHKTDDGRPAIRWAYAYIGAIPIIAPVVHHPELRQAVIGDRPYGLLVSLPPPLLLPGQFHSTTPRLGSPSPEGTSYRLTYQSLLPQPSDQMEDLWL